MKLCAVLAALLLAQSAFAQTTVDDCVAGEFFDGTQCSACPVDTYSAAKATNCSPCPENSWAPKAGSSGCIACYFGTPKVVAGTIGTEVGFWPDNMPSEQPRPGFRVLALGGDVSTCADAAPLDTCGDTTGVGLAIETDQSCQVRVYLLGSTDCSNADNLKVLDGSYVTPSLIEGTGYSISFTNGEAVFGTSGAAACAPSFTVPDTTACVAGSSPDTNPQSEAVAGDDVFTLDACAPCDVGTTCSGNAAAPVSCAAGTFNILIGATTCADCPAGFSSVPGSQSCSECEAGTIPSADKSTCEVCPAGQFSSTSGVDTCQDCAAGWYREAGSLGTQCNKCPPGTFSAAGAAACTPCAAGTATDDSASTVCDPCPAGSYSADDGSYTCNVCPPGTFSATAGSTSCTPCAAGHFTEVSTDGSGATLCKPCAAGTFIPTDATDNKCRSCPVGHSTGGVASAATTCTECPVGYFASKANTVSCSACAPGSIAAATGSKNCRICPAGFITGMNVKTEDTSIGGGFGSDARGATVCEACPRRTFRPSQLSANRCTPCPKGRETIKETGATKCNPCMPGTYLGKTGTLYDLRCKVCPAGTFSDRQGVSDSCTNCAAGTYTSDAGNTVCDECNPGSYQSASAATTCVECNEGSYNEFSKSTSAGACVAAPKGHFAAGKGNDGYTPCEGGSFQDQTGQGSCKDCPPGNECPPGATTKTPCKPGFSADMKQPFCKECDKGTFQNLGAQRSCKPCPAGKFCPNTKMTAPTDCPAGTFGTDVGKSNRNDACAPCPINTFSASTGATKCTKCPAGQWTNRRTGRTACWSTSRQLPPV